MTIEEISNSCGGQVVGDRSMVVENLLTDSRKLFVPEGTIFVALKGVRHDGERYVKELYDHGIRAFVCQRGFDTKPYAEASFVLVDNSLEALQKIGYFRRKSSASRVVAITGSNGKTIVKEWLSGLVGGDLRTVRSPRSYNSQIGVALSLWNIEKDTQLSIIEAGISQRGEMQRLQTIIAPDDVIVTNIGNAHQENFTSIAEKLQEKLTLCKEAKRIFFCQDHEMIATEIAKSFPNAEKHAWSLKGEATCQFTVEKENGRSVLKVKCNELNFSLLIPFDDDVSIENICHAINYAIAIGIDPKNITARAEKLRQIEMRLEQKDGHNNCIIIDDAYNADFTSLEIALDFLHILGCKKGLSKTLILSDLQQTGIDNSELYKRVSLLLQQKNVTRLIGIGPNISREMTAEKNARFFASTAEFLSSMSMADFHDEAILLKGSRIFEFEKITEILAQKRNRTALEVNLNALAHNIAYYRNLLRPTTKLMAMVKAYSYGTGSFEIAKLMQAQGVDYLGVAFADEGYDLRVAGISLPIIVMNPEEHSYDMMLEYGLEPQIYSTEAIEKFSVAAREMGISEARIHVKINTGMNRSGFSPNDMKEVAYTVKKCPNIRVQSIFSHLVGSDEKQFDAFTRHQITLFRQACETLSQELGQPLFRHILNSAGIERFAEHQYEMVRLGIGLYGYGFSTDARKNLRNVTTLKSYISQIHNINAGESIGYSRKTFLKRKSRIAVVPIGYADGLDRRLSNGVGEVIIRGQRAKIVGNVCMDICMVDVTDFETQIGDEVILFGDDNPVWEMSEKIGTIPYEILTGIDRRVRRIYFID